MRPETRAYLGHIQAATELIVQFTANKQLDDYVGDEFLRSAVERQFTIIGEAMGQLARADPHTATRLSEYRLIVDFRNILIHGYSGVDAVLVWNIIETKLPILRAEVAALLAEQ